MYDMLYLSYSIGATSGNELEQFVPIKLCYL